jgi:hypothetical protein
MNESTSASDGSEGGVGQIWSSAVKLCSIKRCAPAFDFRRSKGGTFKFDTECFLIPTTGIETCLDSVIKLWQASVGVEERLGAVRNSKSKHIY